MEESRKKKEGPQYSKFKKINGAHPLKENVPGSFVEYKARVRKEGKLFYFNFDLAREMGLIDKDHPHKLNKELEKTILETFSIVIINEYDIENNIHYPKGEILSNKYMATRYLQLQHENKQGQTSGDGRSIWNGHFKGKKGVTWDISSCGTGATILSPAYAKKQKYIQTGDPNISYGCGYSELDEGIATLIFSEIFKSNKIETERVLALIEFPNNLSITVRTSSNLLRPSHIFQYIKQGDYDGLSNMVNYYIDRQEGNKEWRDVPKSVNKRYEYFLDRQVEVFAKVAARFEDEYIFCWLDWDGDNILMDGGIIDYGSVRQFGLFHSEYRYDDDDRYSTTIIEQKAKSKYIVQTFIQIIDFLISKEKKAIAEYAKHKKLEYFETVFEREKNRNLLYKMGVAPKHHDYLLRYNSEAIEGFRKDFSYFERVKSAEGLHKVSDGINWNAVFCMRDILREYPQMLMSRNEELGPEEFIDIIKSKWAIKEDLELSPYRVGKIQSFQKNYKQILNLIVKQFDLKLDKLLLELSMRSSIINKMDRVTGDSITTIVDEVMKDRKNFDPVTLDRLVSRFTLYQNLNPDDLKRDEVPVKNKSAQLKKFLEIVRDYREGL